MQVILLFENTRIVVKAERLFAEKNIACKILPTPLSVSQHCGMCIQIDNAILPQAEQILIDNKYNFTLYEE